MDCFHNFMSTRLTNQPPQKPTAKSAAGEVDTLTLANISHATTAADSAATGRHRQEKTQKYSMQFMWSGVPAPSLSVLSVLD